MANQSISPCTRQTCYCRRSQRSWKNDDIERRSPLALWIRCSNGRGCHRHGPSPSWRSARRHDDARMLPTRKKRSPLVAADGKTPLAPDSLHAFLGDITKERFVNLFGLSHRGLREGGKEIAGGEGHLGKALFAAASGLTGLRSLRKKIGTLREALYLPTGSKASFERRQEGIRRCQRQAET